MPVQPAPSATIAIDYRVIIVISLLLSLWLIMIDPVLDRDAILYLRAADAYLQDGLLASQKLFGRPLLSICFATLHQVTGLPLLYAGLLLNSLFYALFCVTFVATVSALGGDRRVQLIAAIVVLAHPSLNDQRSSILRDPAYWVFALLAFRQLLLYVQQPGWKHQLYWLAYIGLASLFRFEGLFFAVLAPFALLATQDLPDRGKHCLRLLSPTLIGLVAAVALALFYMEGSLLESMRLPGISRYVDRLLALPEQFGALAAATGNIVLEVNSREDAAAATIAGLATVLLLNICRALSWPVVLVLLSQWRHRDHLRHDNAVLLNAHLWICLAYLATFTLINHFMSERYASQFIIFFLLYLPFLLDGMWRSGKRSMPRILALGLLVILSVDSLHNRNHEKAFIRDAKNWLLTNTPQRASLVSNNEYLAYFSRRDFDWKVATFNRFDLQKLLSAQHYWRDKDYLAMRVTRHNTQAWSAFLRQHSLKEMMVFDGQGHGKVAIVKLRHNTEDANREAQP